MIKFIENKKKIVCIIIVSIITCMLMLTVVGCSGESNSPEKELNTPMNVSVVFCNRNMSSACPNSSILEPYITQALKSSGSITYVRADGNPKPVNYPNADKFKPSTKANDKNADRENKAKVNDFLEFLNGEDSKAQSAEVDLIGAITTASKTFSSNGNENIIIVIDSSIGTAGRCQMPDFLNYDATDFVKLPNMPNLSNVSKIKWCGYNCVDGDQEPIPTDYPAYELIQKNYNSFLRAAGVMNDIEWIPNSNGNAQQDKEGLPKVSTVKFNISDLFGSNWKFVKLDNYQLTFKPDSEEFVDVNSAKNVLNTLAQQLKDNPNTRISIKGYVAVKDNEDGNLSFRRANKVKSLLCDMDVKNEISAIGMGKGPYEYLNSYGQVNPQNRYIEVVKEG